MKISSRQFGLLALLQVCGFAGVFAWRFYVTAKAYLAHPTDDALWAHNWTAQVAGFGVFVAPLFLVSLGVLIAIRQSETILAPLRLVPQALANLRGERRD